MKRAPTLALAVAIAFVFLPQELRAGHEVASFEGSVSATFTRAGANPTHFLFTRKGNQLRIEDTARSKTEPINVVDLDAKKLTIIFPHNSTFVRVDLIQQLPDRAQPGAPPLPPNFPTPPNISSAQIIARSGPSISPPPGFPTPPPMPNNPAATGISNMTMMPPMPAMPGGFGAPELKKTDKTRKIHGFECACYTITDRGQNFEIWATSDSTLFPFRLLQRDSGTRHFGPAMIEETWIESLQKKSLFPLEASLKMEPGGQERLSFKVDKIDKKKIGNDTVFIPPEQFFEIEAPQF